MRDIDGRSFRRTASPEFPEILRQLRQQRNISQIVLARMTEVDNSYISRLEKGSRTPSLALLTRIADALHLGPEERFRLYSAAGFSPLPRPSNVTEILTELRVAANRVAELVAALCYLLGADQAEKGNDDAQSHFERVHHNG